MTAAAPGGRPPLVKHRNWPILGQLPTLLAINKEVTSFAVNEVAREGYELGICRMQLPAQLLALVTDPQMVKELFTCDDWGKEDLERVPTYELVRAAGGNGLFTADDRDPEWAIAHRILTKPFSRQGMIAFVPLMNDMANLMIAAMKRDVGFGGVAQIDEWSTKMAFETIAYTRTRAQRRHPLANPTMRHACTHPRTRLHGCARTLAQQGRATSFWLSLRGRRYCGMGTHFKTFELKEKHEFIRAMETFMSSTKELALMPKFMRRFAFEKNKAFFASAATLKAYLADVIKQRKAGLTKPPGDLPDLLDLMLNSVDSVTNKAMSMENIAFQARSMLQDGVLASLSPCCGALRSSHS